MPSFNSIYVPSFIHLFEEFSKVSVCQFQPQYLSQRMKRRINDNDSGNQYLQVFKIG